MREIHENHIPTGYGPLSANSRPLQFSNDPIRNDTNSLHGDTPCIDPSKIERVEHHEAPEALANFAKR